VKRRSRQLLSVLLFVAIVGVLVWWSWPKRPPPPADANSADANGTGVKVAGGVTDANAPAAPGPANANGSGTGPTTRTGPRDILSPLTETRKLDADTAMKAARAGQQLLSAGKLVQGRAELSKALLSGRLPTGHAAEARRVLSELAERMIFSREVFEDDPYTMHYRFGSGEVLARVERKLKLHVPNQIVLKINRIPVARGIRADQTIKVIRGPFHAIVSKSRFTLDIYLHRPPAGPVFVQRLNVGVGKNGSTPPGMWRIALGRKLQRAPWNPPPNSTETRSIAWGEPGYPLGKDGYWIGLEGVDRRTRIHMGYGVHGTNDPSSIGRSESLGCVRLADADIERVFSLLYEHWSTVEVLP
jgi:lipoprotein-anchoring transpeptidase ErfK/SrfK